MSRHVSTDAQGHSLHSTCSAGFGEVEKRVRTTGGGASGSVRNLRIREDTAKYLLNLDPDSAYYDPKSRSMREDPNPQKVRWLQATLCCSPTLPDRQSMTSCTFATSAHMLFCR